jgi:predicted 3-demethylubiquinone-9 3-methyltransferase (glyoxalase superfamily)
VVGASNTASANAAATNGNVYLNLFDDSTIRQSHKIVGSGATTVTSDSNGVITISSTDTNTDTNTHYTTKLVVGASSTASANAAATNGNVYLNLFDDSTIRQAHKISGTGGTTVTSDADGNITINSTATTDLSNYVTKSGSEEFTGTKTIASSAAIKSKTGSTDYGYMHRNVAFGTSSTPTSDSTYGGSGAIYMYYTS